MKSANPYRHRIGLGRDFPQQHRLARAQEVVGKPVQGEARGDVEGEEANHERDVAAQVAF